MDNKLEQVEVDSISSVFIVWVGVPPKLSLCKTHSGEGKTSGIDPGDKEQVCPTGNMFDVIYWVATGKTVPECHLHETLIVAPQGELEIFSVASSAPSL